jgi:hypothetical protein
MNSKRLYKTNQLLRKMVKSYCINKNELELRMFKVFLKDLKMIHSLLIKVRQGLMNKKIFSMLRTLITRKYIFC